MEGRVYWVTGLSGAGKTTVGSAMRRRLLERGEKAVLLDGDLLIYVLGKESVSYTKEGRLKRAYQYARLCQQLSAQGLTVICCTIAMYEEVRAWNRANIPGYREVFLNVDVETLKRRDDRKLYSTYGASMAGAGEPVELPRHPDLIIRNTYENNAEEYAEQILALGDQAAPSGAYWDGYYSMHMAPEDPSDFARFAMQYLAAGNSLFDMGCGNGRDSLYFAAQGLRVTAMDLSEEAVREVQSRGGGVFAVTGDFIRTNALDCCPFDCYYMRWTLHAVTEVMQHELIDRFRVNARPGSLLLIEARTVHDALYGKGTPSGRDAFVESHYRRFLRPEEVRQELEGAGFEILLCEESQGFSRYNGDDPTLVRLVAKKRA